MYNFTRSDTDEYGCEAEKVLYEPIAEGGDEAVVLVELLCFEGESREGRESAEKTCE